MRIYRRLWLATWLAIAALPVALGVLVTRPIVMICLGVMAATAAVIAGLRRPSQWLTVGLTAAAATAALTMLGGVGLWLVVLAAATAPPAIARLGRWLALPRWRSRHRRTRSSRHRGPADQAMAVLTADLFAGPVHALDDRILCRAWTDSFLALDRARTPGQRLELVNLRQAYLDELESRHPTGFHAWLASDIGPSGDPGRFLLIRPRGQQE